MEDFKNHLVKLRNVVEQLQAVDGSWRFCFESGPMTDAYLIILLRSLGIQEEEWIERLSARIMNLQHASGGWKLYEDEESANLQATVEAYYGLLFSGLYSKEDKRFQPAKQIIRSKGGLSKVIRPTKVILELTGQLPWKTSFFPKEFILLPQWFPINFYDLVGFSRVHIAPVVIAANQKYSLRSSQTPDLQDLLLSSPNIRINPDLSSKRDVNSLSMRKLEHFLLERIEENGTLLSYASCTYLMIFALLAIGYPKDHPIIMRAISGIKSLAYETARGLHIQNSSSTVWDTALISYSLQEAGLAADSRTIRKAGQYLLSRQHVKKGDWQVHNPKAEPGGWGFSDINTLNPDIDDTTACLRAISQLAKVSEAYQSAWTKGMSWLLSMQNRDGGWPAFEKNTNKKLLSMLSIDGA
ncbi:MAG: sqhC 2, partial [Bacilli bacterium]|nr:sqhC 2 [Bacilli bacterium]